VFLLNARRRRCRRHVLPDIYICRASPIEFTGILLGDRYLPGPYIAVTDLHQVLASAGVPSGAIRAAMAAAHHALVNPAPFDATKKGDKAAAAAAAAAAAQAAAAHTPREASRWAELSGELLARGVPAGAAMAAAWEHVYSRGEANAAARNAAAAAFNAACAPYLDALRGRD